MLSITKLVVARRPVAVLAVALTSTLLLAAAFTAYGQEGSASNRLASPTGTSASGATAANPSAAASKASLPVNAAPTAAPASAPIDTLIQRVETLARVVESAASAAKQPTIDPAQDLKALILNVISSRVDDILFGDGKGSVGLAAQVVAVLAFAIALVRFMMAVALLNPATPATKWGQFKAWTRRSGVVRAINVVIGALAVLFTGAALYVVVTARAAPDNSGASLAAINESLATCQAALAARPSQPAGTLASAPVPMATVEAIQKSGAACEAAVRATDARVTQIGETVVAIDAKQSWTLTKVLAFLAWLYMLGAVTFLVVKRLDS